MHFIMTIYKSKLTQTVCRSRLSLVESGSVCFIACAGFDLACFGECDPRKLWTDKLIDQNAEEDDVPDHASHFFAK